MGSLLLEISTIVCSPQVTPHIQINWTYALEEEQKYVCLHKMLSYKDMIVLGFPILEAFNRVNHHPHWKNVEKIGHVALTIDILQPFFDFIKRHKN